MSRARLAVAFAAVVALTSLALVVGCGGNDRSRDRASGRGGAARETPAGETPAGTAGGTGTPQGAGPADTSREGRTFVATYDDGPVDRLRIVRDTAGGLVVEGATGFPDGTAVLISLLRPTAGGRTETVAATRALVELGRFQGEPLLAASGPVPEGPVTIRVLVSFAPGRQSDAVLQATARGRRFGGAGMRDTPDGHAVYESTVEANL
ncbi:MAG: hypothetical protein ACREOU_02605 [Candidatus Eiseniibacteriota bacterium]